MTYVSVTGDAGPPLTRESGRHVAAAKLLVPTVVQLDPAGEHLWWSDPFAERMPSAGLLKEFIALADAPEAEIRNYARQWGVLNTCPAHNLPHTHQGQRRPVQWVNFGTVLRVTAIHNGIRRTARLDRFIAEAGADLERVVAQLLPCRPREVRYDNPPPSIPSDALSWEPVSVWRLFASQARAILQIANRLDRGATGDPEAWATVYALSGRTAPWWQQTVSVERTILARVVNEWLAMAGARPSVRWNRQGDAEISLTGDTLFAHLAVKLAFAVSGSEGFAVCSACGGAYAPQRRPKTGQRNFCPACRKAGAPVRAARRSYLEREREARETRNPRKEAGTKNNSELGIPDFLAG